MLFVSHDRAVPARSEQSSPGARRRERHRRRSPTPIPAPTSTTSSAPATGTRRAPLAASVLIEASGMSSARARIVRERPGTPLIVLRSGLSERSRDYPKGEELCFGSGRFRLGFTGEPWRLALRLRSRNTVPSVRRLGSSFTQEADMRRTFVALALGALVVAGWPATPAFAQPTKTARGTVTAMARRFDRRQGPEAST